MNYKETLQYIYNKLPSLEKKGWGAYKPGLDRINEQLTRLNNPHESFDIIHVAGTNGKGSVSSLLASVLMESGKKVGLFTSPHLLDFRERIKVNGVDIPEKEVISFVAKFSEKMEDLNPSFFEYTFAMAMEYFREQKVGVAVIETGLGGRLDCTNVVRPILSVITNVSLDHVQFLGNTISAIATEKAGIIKEGVDVVIGRKQNETTDVFKLKAVEENTNVFYSNENLLIRPMALKGSCQAENQRTVLESVQRLNAGGFSILEEQVNSGLVNVLHNTNFKGRFQILSKSPFVICDVAHNFDGVTQLVSQISELQDLPASNGKDPSGIIRKINVVWGMSEDKDVEAILKLLPKQANYFWCGTQNARSMSSTDLKIKGLELQLKGEGFSTMRDAYLSAIEETNEADILLIAGSTFVVADLLGFLEEESKSE